MTRAQGQRGAARSPAAGRSGSSGSLRREWPLPTRDPAPGRAGPSAGLSRGGACRGRAIFLAARPPKNPASAGCGEVVPRRLERTRLLAGHLTPERKGRSGGEPRKASSPPRPAQAGLEGQRGTLQSARLRAGVQGCHGIQKLRQENTPRGPRRRKEGARPRPSPPPSDVVRQRARLRAPISAPPPAGQGGTPIGTRTPRGRVGASLCNGLALPRT